MPAKQLQMALIIDEYGGTAGLVTAEELAEEVMGHLIDEWVSESPSVEPLREGDEVRYGKLLFTITRMKGPKIEEVHVEWA